MDASTVNIGGLFLVASGADWKASGRGETAPYLTAVITVEGYNPMVATWSERDSHDDQIMQAARDVLRLMRANGSDVGHIDLIRRPRRLATSTSSTGR